MAQHIPVSPLASPDFPIEPRRHRPGMLDMRLPFMGGPPPAGTANRQSANRQRAERNGYQDAVAAVERENAPKQTQGERTYAALREGGLAANDVLMRARNAEASFPPEGYGPGLPVGVPGGGAAPMPSQPMPGELRLPIPPKVIPWATWNDLNYPQLAGRRVSPEVKKRIYEEYLTAMTAEQKRFDNDMARYKAQEATAQFIIKGERARQPRPMSMYEREQAALARDKFRFEQQPKRYQPKTQEEEFRRLGMIKEADAARERRIRETIRTERAKTPRRKMTAENVLAEDYRSGKIDLDGFVKKVAQTKASPKDFWWSDVKMLSEQLLKIQLGLFGAAPPPEYYKIRAKLDAILDQGREGYQGASAKVDQRALQALRAAHRASPIPDAQLLILLEAIGATPATFLGRPGKNESNPNANPFGQKFPR